MCRARRLPESERKPNEHPSKSRAALRRGLHLHSRGDRAGARRRPDAAVGEGGFADTRSPRRHPRLSTFTRPPRPAPKPVGKGVPALPPEKAQPVRIARFDKAPVIDGKLDDDIWKTAAVLKDFYQINPGDNIAPTKPTETMIGYDAKFLYIAFHCYDEPDKVRATVAKRDDVMNGDDSVRILLDTFNDQRKAYVLVFNPLGVQQDGIRTEGTGADFSVDIVMESKGVDHVGRLRRRGGGAVQVAALRGGQGQAVGRARLPHHPAPQRRAGLVDAHLARRGRAAQPGRPHHRPRRHLDRAHARTHPEPHRLRDGPARPLAEPRAGRGERESADSGTLRQPARPLRAQPDGQVRRLLGAHARPRHQPGLRAGRGRRARQLCQPALPDLLRGEAPLLPRRHRNLPHADRGRPHAHHLRPGRGGEGDGAEGQVHLRPALRLGQRARQLRGRHPLRPRAPARGLRPSERAELEGRHLPRQARHRQGELHRLPRHVLQLRRTRATTSAASTRASSSTSRPRSTSRCSAPTRASARSPGPKTRTRARRRTASSTPTTSTRTRATTTSTSTASGAPRATSRSSASRAASTRTAHNFNFGYFTEPKPKAKITSWETNHYAGGSFDWQGRSQNWTYEGQVGPNLQRQTYVRVGYNTGYERVFASEFGAERFANGLPETSETSKNFFAYAGSQPTKRINFFYFFGYRVGAARLRLRRGPPLPARQPLGHRRARGAGAGRCASEDDDFVAPAVCSGLSDPGGGGYLYTNGNVTYKATKDLNMTLSFSKNRLVRDDTGLVAFDTNIYQPEDDLPVHALHLRARARRLRFEHFALQRPVPLRLDAQPGHGLLRRLQRRPQPQLLQPLLGAGRAGAPAQLPQLLHQSLLPLPPQLLKQGVNRKP